MGRDGLSPYAELKLLRWQQEQRDGARCSSDADTSAEDADDGRDIQIEEPGRKAIAHRNAHQAPDITTDRAKARAVVKSR